MPQGDCIESVKEERWRSHRGVAAAVSLVAVLLPFCVSTLAILALVQIYPRPSGDLLSGPVGLWCATVLGVGIGVAMLVERASRRLLPLAALLQVSLLFPDRAPSRTLIAVRAGAHRAAASLLTDPDTSMTEAEAASHVLLLASALSRHDRITRGHCERVRAYANLMADELGLEQHDADRLKWAALLHDVGKLRVSYAILNKKGKLDADEWEAIKRHPTDGQALVAPLADWLGPWADAVVQHHERFDGGGYPHGLSGHEISVGARIVAIVDAFDVMTASRSYKRPVSTAEALQELERCAGSQFDPELVKAFLAIPTRRSTWLSGVAAALVQIRAASYLAGVPGRAAHILARLPAVASAATVGAASVVVAVSLSPAVVAPAAASDVGRDPSIPTVDPSSSSSGSPGDTSPSTTAPPVSATPPPTTTASPGAGLDPSGTTAPGTRSDPSSTNRPAAKDTTKPDEAKDPKEPKEPKDENKGQGKSGSDESGKGHDD